MAIHKEDRSLFAAGAFPTFFNDPDFDRRACHGQDLNLFFPDHGGSKHLVATAKRLCNRCPIQRRCRAWALSRPWADVAGVWGGLTQQERREEQLKGKQECPRCNRWIAVRDGRLVLHHSAPKWICR